MIKIYKYEICRSSFSNRCVIEMPHDAKIIKVGTQDDKIFIWAEIRIESSVCAKAFYIFLTGEDIPADTKAVCDYLDTVFLNNGLVFHIYKVSL